MSTQWTDGPEEQYTETQPRGLELPSLSPTLGDDELEMLTAPDPPILELAPSESAAIPEPEMDELLAELLAQEPSLDVLGELPDDLPPEVLAPSLVPEPTELEPVIFSLEPIEPPSPLETVDMLIPEPDILPVLEFTGDESLLPEPESMEIEALAAVPAELAALDPAPVEALVSESAEAPLPVDPAPVDDAPAEVAAVEAEPAIEPAPPQPALETVVRSIDEALEAAPPVANPVEPAAPAHHHKQFSQLDDYVVFSLSGTDYAVPVRDVSEIGRIPSITRLPNVPDFIRGITNLRGEVVPVLSLPNLLGLQDTPATARGRVLFLQPRERVSSTGLVVDEVKGIQRIQSQQLEQVTGLVDDKVTAVLRGVHGRGDRLLNVLDLEQLFHLQEFQQLESR